MRKCTFGWVLSIAVLLPTVGTAQVYVRPNPYPQVTAANAAWAQRGTPVFHAGAFYYPVWPIDVLRRQRDAAHRHIRGRADL